MTRHAASPQPVQHGAPAGVPRAAQPGGNHGLREGREQPLGQLAKHQHGHGRQKHGSSPQRPRAIHILLRVRVRVCAINAGIVRLLLLLFY